MPYPLVCLPPDLDDTVQVSRGGAWQAEDPLPQHTRPGTPYEARFTRLQPHTQYVFRVRVIYRSMQPVVWRAPQTYTTDGELPASSYAPRLTVQGPYA